MSLKTLKLLILVSVTHINKERSYKLPAGLLATLHPSLLKGKNTLGKSQISGVQVLYYLVKSVDICPLKIRTLKAYTRKF